MDKRKVVFDVDDTLWGLNKRICDEHNIDLDKIKNYHLFDNDELTENEKNIILQAYKNPETFKNIKWFKGIESINELEQLNCEVHINSNSFNQEIALHKVDQLSKILNIPMEHIEMLFVNSHKNIGKDTSNTFIFVDDSPYNIAESKAEHNIVLKMHWNSSEQARRIIGNKNVIYRESLEEIIDTIKNLLKE